VDGGALPADLQHFVEKGWLGQFGLIEVG